MCSKDSGLVERANDADIGDRPIHLHHALQQDGALHFCAHRLRCVLRFDLLKHSGRSHAVAGAVSTAPGAAASARTLPGSSSCPVACADSSGRCDGDGRRRHIELHGLCDRRRRGHGWHCDCRCLRRRFRSRGGQRGEREPADRGTAAATTPASWARASTASPLEQRGAAPQHENSDRHVRQEREGSRRPFPPLGEGERVAVEEGA